jgi:hypothetical protein
MLIPKIVLLLLAAYLLYRMLKEEEAAIEVPAPQPAAPVCQKPQEKKELVAISQVDEEAVKIIYAANVDEDWRRLQILLEHAEEKRADLVVLTKLLSNPLTPEEQSAYTHAFQYVSNDFNTHRAFSDIHQFIATFASDPSPDILTVSAKKILQLIEKGKKVIQEKIAKFNRIMKGFDLKVVIIPGQFENIEVLRGIDEAFAARYLNLATLDVKNLRLLGIGGQVTLEKNAPLYFQNRDYVEGTEQSHEELKEILFNGVDVFVSYTPIRYFADNPFEEENIRHYLCDYLPGKVILTSQDLPSDPMVHPVTASDAALIKGGHFGRQKEGDRSGHFWELVANKKGLVQKTLIQI